MPTLEIGLLGAYQLRLNGNLAPNPPTKKAQALLAYLAVEGHTPHARERLALLLWPDQPRAQAFDSLRQTLYLLRKSIPPACLHTTRSDVQVDQQADYHLDVATFSQLIAASQHHAATHSHPCSVCLEQLEQATALYRGDFLQHFVLPESEPFAEWVMLKREGLQRAALGALFQLAEHYAQQANYERSRQYAWRQIELDPPREEAHRQLMWVLALGGRRSEALEQYERCRRILADAVDTEPAQETTALYEQIRLGNLPDQETKRQGDKENLSRGALTLSPLHPVLLSPPHNLPAQLAPLIGRDREKQELLQLLANPAVRLITLLGAGGIGKTHLALAVAATQLTYFPDGVYFVDLAPLSSPTTIITAIAEAIKLSLTTGSDPQQQLCFHLRSKQLLLLLDNFEHLLAGVHMLVGLLQAAPGLQMVVTSRTRLHLQSEQLFPLDGLAFPQDDQAAPAILADYGAVKLFLQQARRARRRYEPAAAEWPAIVRICRLLQGMPLGILLAAAWLEFYTPAEVAQQISQNLSFLESDWRDMPARHRSMRAVFDQSWRLLSERERTIFAQLAIFRGGFTFAAVQSVTQATARELMGLLDRSLVRHSQGINAEGRFELHELVRQFAAEKLEKDARGAEAARDRHAAFFAAFVQQQHADMGKPQQAVALAAVDSEIENVRAAWDWGVAQGRVEWLQQALAGLDQYYRVRGWIKEGTTTFAAARERLERMIAKTIDPVIVWLKLLVDLLRFQAIYAWMLDDLIGVERLLQRGLEIIEILEREGQDSAESRAFILRELGRLTMRHNRVAAQEFFEQSLALYQARNDQQGAVHVMGFLGEIAWKMNDLAGATRWFEQSLEMLQRLDDQEPRASVLAFLGVIALYEGRVTQAEQYQRTALAIVQSLGGETSHELLLLGDILVAAGKFAEGRLLFEERIRRNQRSGSHSALAHVYNSLAQAYLHMGEYTQAHSNMQKSLALLRDLDEPRHLGNAQLTQAQLLLVEEAHAEAYQIVQTNTEKLRACGENFAWSLICCSYPALKFGAISQVRQNLAEALQMATETRGFFTVLVALPPLALLFLALDEPRRAIELYTLALQHPFVANSRWFAHVAGRPITAAMAQLPLDVVRAAQEKGRNADLWPVAHQLLQNDFMRSPASLSTP